MAPQVTALSERARSVPVLVTTFNRPALTSQVMSSLEALGPTKLFFAQDGPRIGRPDDVAACAAVRRLITHPSWTCETAYLLREHNLGCRLAMVGAIDWFFDSVDRGIVLEDDCLPSPDFFEFAAELLDHYAPDERVGMISGTNLLGSWTTAGRSYHFGYGAVWGWATWRRAWRNYDRDLVGLTHATSLASARRQLGSARWRQLAPLLEAAANGSIDTWDYQWTFTLAETAALTAIPAVNLVTNVGFGSDATHTTRPSALANLPSLRLGFPLRHPADVSRDAHFDRRVLALESGPGIRRLRRRVRSRLGVAFRYLQRNLPESWK